MSIELYWDNDDQTVLRCEFPRHWTWDEMYATLDQIKQITDHADREIGAILDVRQGISIPGGLFTPSSLEHAKRMLKLGEGGSGTVVVVGASPLIKTVAAAFRGLDADAVSHVSFVDTPDQARAILVERNHRYEGLKS